MSDFRPWAEMSPDDGLVSKCATPQLDCHVTAWNGRRGCHEMNDTPSLRRTHHYVASSLKIFPADYRQENSNVRTAERAEA
jgi:hypothetical protein